MCDENHIYWLQMERRVDGRTVETENSGTVDIDDRCGDIAQFVLDELCSLGIFANVNFFVGNFLTVKIFRRHVAMAGQRTE